MTKAMRMMKEDIKLIDLVIELLDARAPISSRNPDINELAKGKSRLIILNKYDLSDEKKTEAFERYFKDAGLTVVKCDSRNSGNVKQIGEAIKTACREKTERDRKKGIMNRPVRAMVAGIPNVGKSTLINTLAGRASAKTGNKPGVTRGKQWIRLNKQVELLDTPGVLWPKFEDRETGLKLALLGTINDDIVDERELALELIALSAKEGFLELEQRYGIEGYDENLKAELTEGKEGADILTRIAKARGALLKGGEFDIDKASRILLDDFRSGKLGRVTLDNI